jgi:hypothetical protein
LIRGGLLDKDDVLWITGEHFVRDKPLSYHARYLPRDVMWYADPSEPGTICELRCAGFTIQKADNAQNPGISAVQTRIEAGTLRVLGSACPNLVGESELYRYEEDGDKPAKEYDHALDALRYLIFKLDAKRLARKKWFWQRDKKEGSGETAEEGKEKVKRPWLLLGTKPPNLQFVRAGMLLGSPKLRSHLCLPLRGAWSKRPERALRK